MLKRLLNLHEEVTHSRLREACAANNAHVYAKVRLADVLPIEGSGISDPAYRFSLQAHFDFVVSDQDHRPLFAVEFDGPGHKEPRQQARDVEKDGLCERFGLPILRVNARYLPKKYRDMDLLTWFVHVWFAHRCFDEAQEAGHVPYDEPFMPQSFVNIPGQIHQFPLWLSATARNHIHRLFGDGKVLDLAPSQLIGRDSHGHYHALAFLRIKQDSGVMAETGMRSQRFPVSETEALDEIVTNMLYEKLSRVLAAETDADPRAAIEARIAEFASTHRIARAFHVGGSFHVPEFKFNGSEPASEP